MSWSIGLCTGESFAEFSAISDSSVKNPPVHHRWYLPKQNLVEGLKKILSENNMAGSTIHLASGLAQLIMKRRAGASIALLVTSGFENWPKLRQPLRESRLSLSPRRTTPLLSDDLIFGINERVAADGEVLSVTPDEELEFLSQKLELMEIKNVVIGFLNSQKNSANEKKAADFFRLKNFEVSCSHELENSNNEVARWWRAVLTSYVGPAFKELEETLKPLEEQFQVKFKFVSAEGDSFSDEPRKYFTSALAQLTCLANASGKKVLWDGILHFGLESFQFIEPDRVNKIWNSDFGPVALTTPEFSKLRIQPTQIVDPQSVASLFARSQESGFEPGPMLLGRGLRATFLDLVYLENSLLPIQGLSEWIHPDSQNKIRQSLSTLFKGHFSRDHSPSEILQDNCVSILAQDISQKLSTKDKSRILCLGPLAPTMVPLLQAKTPWLELAIEKISPFAESTGCK